MTRVYSTLRTAGPLLAGLSVVLALLIGPQAAAAHSQLVQADPAAGQVLTTAPTAVRLLFSEQVALDFSTVQVVDRGRHPQDTGPVIQPDGGVSLGVALNPDLPSGVYTVIWHVVSAVDGHVTEGNYAFSVQLPGDPTPAPGAGPVPDLGASGGSSATPVSSSPDVSPIRWALRALALVAAAWLLGGPLFTVLVLEPVLLSRAGNPALLAAAQRRWGRLSVGAAVALLGLLGADMLFQVSDLAGVSPLAAIGQGDILSRFVTGTSFGLYWALQVGAALLVGLLCVWLARAARADDAVWSMGVAAAGMIFAGAALSSHPAATAPLLGLPLGTLSDLIHLMAAGAWVGGLLYIAVVLLPLLHSPAVPAAERETVLARAVPRFSDLALLSVGLLIITGVVNVALRTLDLGALVDSSYGQTLVVKHLLFLPLLVIGVLQNRRVTPRLMRLLAGPPGTGGATVSLFQRLIRAEAVLVCAMLLCAAGLTLLPPPTPVSAVTLPPVPVPLPLEIPTPSGPPVVVTGTQTLGGLTVGLVVQPNPAGDLFTVLLRRVDATPLITHDLRLQLKVTPQDINAGSTLLPLAFAGRSDPTLTYSGTAPVLTLAGGYDVQIIVSQRSGNDVKLAYRLDMDENGGLTIKQAPFIQAAVSTLPSPPISGTIQIDLRVSDGVGAPVTGATITIIPMMPSHGHVVAQLTATPVAGTPGLYRAQGQLQMAGGWLLVIDVTPPGQPPMRTDASFDVTDPDATP